MAVKKLFLILLMIVLVVTCVCGGCTTKESGPVNIKVAFWAPDVLPPAVALKKAMDYIVENSDGQFQYEWYPAGSLVTFGQTYDAVTSGICDLTTTFLSAQPGRFPLSGVMDLPPYYNNLEDAANDWQFFNKHLLDSKWTDEWSEVKVLASSPSDVMAILANKPIRTMDDAKGLRVCGVGDCMRVWEPWGGTPTNMTLDEAYEAIQRGLADGVYAGVMGAKVRNWAEVAPYTTALGTNTSSGVIFMNAQKYDALPKNVKNLFDEVFPDMVNEWTIQITNGAKQAGIDYINEIGGEYIVLSEEELVPWRMTAIKAINEPWAADMDAKGLRGTEILQERYDFLKPYMPETIDALGN